MLYCLSTTLLWLSRFHTLCHGNTLNEMCKNNNTLKKKTNFFVFLLFFSSCHRSGIFEFLSAMLKIEKMKTKILGLWDQHQVSGKLATSLPRTQEEIHMEDLLICAGYLWIYKDIITPAKSLLRLIGSCSDRRLHAYTLFAELH